jgi:peptide/nickel transport system permease protein
MTTDMQALGGAPDALGGGGARPSGLRATALRRLRKDPISISAFILLVLLILAAIIGGPLAAWLTGHGPNTQFANALAANSEPIGIMARTYLPGGTTHNPHGSLFILGADALGRDTLVRVLYGARISLLVATSATALALVIGVSLGLLAGYLGGWVDAVVNRLTETAMAFPNLLLAVGIAVVIGPGLLNVVIIIALFTWYYPARIVRGATIATKRTTFVAAAKTVGAKPRRILLVHLLPQVWGPLLVYGTSIIANNIIFEAGLSYLGVGVPPPTATWGQMLSDAVTSGMYQTDLTLALAPGLALVLTMLAFNLLGDGIRDALDPNAGHSMRRVRR